MITMLTIIYFVITIGIIRIFYKYFTRNFTYWKQFGIPGPKPLVGFGTMHYKITRSMAELELEWHQQFGDIYGLYLGNEPILTICNPKHIKDILVRDFNQFYDRRHLNTYHEVVNQNLFFALGKQWKRIRNIMSPSFTNSKLKILYCLMDECVDNTIQFLNTIIITTPVIDLKQILGNLTMDVIATTVFATKIQSNKDKNNPFLLYGTKFFQFQTFRYLAAFLLPKSIVRFVMKSQFDEKVNQFFINISRLIINERRCKGIKNADLIQLLIDAEGDDGKKLTENEILGQCWVLFLAGFETTMATLNYCLYELALNVELQDELYSILKQKTQDGKQINFDTIKMIDFLEATIFETLRKYPPVIRLERRAANDYQLSDTNVMVRKGQMIEIPVYAVHHSEVNFPRPECFDVTRFIGENKKCIKPYTFIPFGEGPRNCIGIKFAFMEIKLALTKLILNFKFETSPRTQIPLIYNRVSPFLAINDNYLKVTIRNKSM